MYIYFHGIWSFSLVPKWSPVAMSQECLRQAAQGDGDTLTVTVGKGTHVDGHEVGIRPNSTFYVCASLQCLFHNDISYSAWSCAALVFKCSGSLFLWTEKSLGVCKHRGLGRTWGQFSSRPDEWAGAHSEAWLHLTTRKSGTKGTLEVRCCCRRLP